MPQYNLSGPETQIVVSWLFEPDGYLDSAVNSAGQSARQALAANAALDVYEWIRTNTKGTATAQSNWNECAMVWWIWNRNGSNVTPANRPPESPAWVTTLNEWDTSITQGFARTDQGARNQKQVDIYNQTGVLASTMPAGSHLAAQQTLINRVRNVLQ